MLQPVADFRAICFTLPTCPRAFTCGAYFASQVAIARSSGVACFSCGQVTGHKLTRSSWPPIKGDLGDNLELRVTAGSPGPRINLELTRRNQPPDHVLCCLLRGGGVAILNQGVGVGLGSEARSIIRESITIRIFLGGQHYYHPLVIVAGAWLYPFGLRTC